jgi:hypothetical protein
MSTPKHGTISRHKHHKCDCTPCVAAWRAYNAQLRRDKAYGRPPRLVDAAPVRAHVRSLQSTDMGLRQIAALAGVAAPTLSRLLYGSPSSGIAPRKRLKPETAAALLAVQAGTLAEGVRIDGTGTRRRLEALGALGWTVPTLAARSGLSRPTLHNCHSGTAVTVRTARLLRELYDRMWNEVPPETNRAERSKVQRARIGAARRGWAPPMAWDDDSIDDPAAQPQGVAKPNLKRRLPSVDELAWLMDQGETQEAIAMRFKVHVKSLKSAQIRAHRKAAA